jgi:hypothetical protein
LLVSERTSDDRGVDCLDIHLGLLFAEHVYIIAVWAIQVYRKIQQKLRFPHKKLAIFGQRFHKYL